MLTGRRITLGIAVLALPLVLTPQHAQELPKLDQSTAAFAIAFEAAQPDGGADLMLIDAEGRSEVRLASGGRNATPAWSPAGEWIAFTRSSTSAPGIYMIRGDGTGLCLIVPTTGWHYGAPAWSPKVDRNGQYKIVYTDRAPGQTQPDLFVTTAKCDATDARRLTDTPTSAEATPAWSADNRLALHVNEGKRYGEMHVYDVVAASSGIRLVHRVNLTSTGPLAGMDVGSPAWSRDGKELLVHGGGDLWIISASTPGLVTRLTDTPRLIEVRPTWSPDFKRIGYDANGELHIAEIKYPWALGASRGIRDRKRGSAGHPSWRPIL